MTTIVTGASGLTAGDIVRRLLAEGDSVIAVSRRPTGIEGASEVLGDCGDPDLMRPLLAQAHRLVHVAGILEGPRVARLPGVATLGRLVVISSAGVYSAHRASATAYLAGERAIASANPSALFVRPTMIYGSARDRNIHHVVQFAHRFRFLPQVGSGRARLQPIHYEDLAATTIALLKSARAGTIDAGGRTAIPLGALLREVLDALGLPKRVLWLPAGPLILLARAADGIRGGRLAEQVARMSEERTVDIVEAVEASAVVPRTFEQGIRDEIAAMRRDGTIR